MSGQYLISNVKLRPVENHKKKKISSHLDNHNTFITLDFSNITRRFTVHYHSNFRGHLHFRIHYNRKQLVNCNYIAVLLYF